MRTLRTLALVAVAIGTLALAGCAKPNCNSTWDYPQCNLIDGGCGS